ncbi:uncharacterized protein Z519_01908 [Cladophialophora bantiana CBS 173.52]|uniref:Uncharacterized protein n=1 Tax=Cladophialophora bantiana (strain ATCC 10958 / CBS 173.52 / CDC B-1940 / NIH 8579) TaxID=1442370 RepID=A0A0D2INH9_CLAB1|nr:uncharacterized protein Z519_01908 [Cladophialophora bantiana CBS 173.52]KIW98324.1 hypothetical protein Z519_01908 [Cladophialophora bantiana CBS 173.52]
MIQGLGASPGTIFWRHAAPRRFATLIADPHTRHGEDVLSGIIALLHGYLHRYRGVREDPATTDRPHSAGLRAFISRVGEWDKLDLSLQVEQYVRMAMIMTNLRLGSYLDDLEASSVGRESLHDWHAEVNQVASLFSQMDAWALQHDQTWALKYSIPRLDKLGQLLAPSSGICNHCHRLFILVWLGLTRWHSRSNPGQYEDILQALNHRFQSLPCQALPDFSWAIVSSQVGDPKSHGQAIDILKFLHLTRPSTQE